MNANKVGMCVVCLAALVGCGDDGDGGTAASSNTTSGASSSGGVPVDTTNFCDAWLALCPNDADEGAPGPADDLAYCEQTCEAAQMMTDVQCWFKACSVETGLCDNQESGDPSILACGTAHGWR